MPTELEFEEIDLGPIDGIDGIDGSNGINGKKVELRASATAIQQRYVGDTAWADLVLLSAITGPRGLQGIDGKKVMLQKTSTHVQIKYEGDAAWTNLIPLSEIKGPQGPKGESPVVEIGEVTTLAPNAQATATVVTVGGVAKLSMGIPSGVQGVDGVMGGDTLPVGSLAPFSGTALQDGWLWCNGQAINRTAYKDLFDIIGTTYGAGNGTTTFNLPNLANPLSYDKVGVEGIQFKSLDPELKYIIKAKQVVPIVASVSNDITNRSTINAPSMALFGGLRDDLFPSGVNDFGVIYHSTPIDVNTLLDGRKHRVPSGCANLPIDGYFGIDNIVYSAGYAHQFAYKTEGNVTFARYVNNGVFGQWKLIAGEILLWSGTATEGTVITSSFDLGMFSNFAVTFSEMGVARSNNIPTGNIKNIICSGGVVSNSNQCYGSFAYLQMAGNKVTISKSRIVALASPSLGALCAVINIIGLP